MTVDLTKSWGFSPLEMVWEPGSLPKKKKLVKELITELMKNFIKEKTRELMEEQIKEVC